MISRLAEEIAGDFRKYQEEADSPQETVVVLTVLKSANRFGEELKRLLFTNHGIETESEYVTSQSYIGQTSTGNPLISAIKPEEFAGKYVVVVEDMIDTGATLEALLKLIDTNPPDVLHVAVLLEKIREHRKLSANTIYVGAGIEDFWVHGFGIDTDGLYRYLNDLMVRISSLAEWREYRESHIKRRVFRSG